MKTIGIIGTRRRNAPVDLSAVRVAVKMVYEDGDRFVSGGCPMGGDRFAEIIAREMGATITIHHANWKKHGRSAGFRRNRLIAEDSHVLIACVASDRTGGTEDTIERFTTIQDRAGTRREGSVILV